MSDPAVALAENVDGAGGLWQMAMKAEGEGEGVGEQLEKMQHEQQAQLSGLAASPLLLSDSDEDNAVEGVPLDVPLDMPLDVAAVKGGEERRSGARERSAVRRYEVRPSRLYEVLV